MSGKTITYVIFIVLALLSIGLTGASLGKADSMAQDTQGAMARDLTAVLTGVAFIGCSIWCLTMTPHTVGAGYGGY